MGRRRGRRERAHLLSLLTLTAIARFDSKLDVDSKLVTLSFLSLLHYCPKTWLHSNLVKSIIFK
jgi:hypothetical protein